MSRRKPEERIRSALRDYLEGRGWMVEIMHGNAFQQGVPDLYIHHPQYHYRWIDVKVEGHYSFTKAQRIKWPLWESYGIGIWILTAATQDQYDRLFHPPNWRDYWRDSWGELESIESILEAIDQEAAMAVPSNVLGNGLQGIS